MLASGFWPLAQMRLSDCRLDPNVVAHGLQNKAKTCASAMCWLIQCNKALRNRKEQHAKHLESDWSVSISKLTNERLLQLSDSVQ